MTRLPVLLCAVTGLLFGQGLDNRSLNGKYFFRQLSVTTSGSGVVTSAANALGTILFDGNGKLTVTGQQASGNTAATALTASGTYAVDPAGLLTLTNPIRASVSLNARLGSGAVVGATTEVSDNTFDLFVAIPAPAAAASTGSVSGTYWVSTLEAAGGTASGLRSALFALKADGAGKLADLVLSGHAASAGDQPQTQTLTGASYTMTADGSGTLSFPNSPLLGSAKTLYVSADGNFLLAGSTANGAQDLLVGVKQTDTALSTADWKDRFVSAGLRIDTNNPSNFAGTVNANGSGTLTWSQRIHAPGLNGAVSFSGVGDYSLGSGGAGDADFTHIGFGAKKNAFVAATISPVEPTVYEMYIGVRLPSVSGTGVYVNPQGVVNSASFAPVGNPISPGQFVTLFGSGLSSATTVAQTTTFPATLGGVSVTINNAPAPLYFVSPAQISALVPFSTTGATASIVVNNNGARSAAVTVPLAKTAPGVFAANQAGSGLGAMLHANFSLVTPAAPAHRGETILVYLTGLGAVAPAVADGVPASTSVLSRTAETPTVYIGGVAAPVLFSGLAPGFAGLYQINVTVPPAAPLGTDVPLAIATGDHFHDQVTVPVGP